MFVVFECHKCGHRLFVQQKEGYPERFSKIAGMSCPNCGEQREGLWGLLGTAKKFKGTIRTDWEEDDGS